VIWNRRRSRNRRVAGHHGRIVIEDPRNEWRSIKNDAGEELYAPTELVCIDPPAKIPRVFTSAGTPIPAYELGNPVVGLEFLDYVKIHARFK
jgi:hypothetical protein